MKYPELTNKCKNCTGCNLLELPFFTGKEKCEVVERKIEQMKMEGFKNGNKQ